MSDGTRNPAATGAGEILRARARTLARPQQRAAPPAALLELLEFRLAQERYAVETRHVREVYPLKDLTPLPCTPPYVRGIVNVRGRITPVIDLKKLLDLPDEGLTDLHRIILVQDTVLEFGLLADVIVGVCSIPVDALQATLPTLTNVGAEYVKGVTAECLVVLDMAHILADPKLNWHEEA